MSDRSLRLAILTTRDLVGHGLRSMLAGLPVPVRFTDTLDASFPVDVVIVDATGTADEAARGLEDVTATSTAPVVVLTSQASAPGFDAWSQRVHAFLTVSATQDQVVDVVASALRASAVSHARRALAAPPTASGLSGRERDVLAHIAAGRSNLEIAAEMFLGVNTIKTYIRTAYRKAGVATRPQAVIWALAHGLGPDGVEQAREDQDTAWVGTELA